MKISMIWRLRSSIAFRSLSRGAVDNLNTTPAKISAHRLSNANRFFIAGSCTMPDPLPLRLKDLRWSRLLLADPLPFVDPDPDRGTGAISSAILDNMDVRNTNEML